MRSFRRHETAAIPTDAAAGPRLEDRSYLAYSRPTPRPFLHFVSGHLPAGTITQPHAHPCIVLHGCLQGPLLLCRDEGESLLEAGVFYLIGPRQRHFWRNDGRETAATLSLQIDTTGQGRWPAASGLQRCCSILDAQVHGFHRFTTADDHELHHTFWLTGDHLTAEEPRETLALTGLLLTLLGQLAERIGDAARPLPADFDDAQRIRRLLLTCVRERLTIPEIARRIGTSPTRAKQLFRDAFGCGIITYFNQLKIWQAKRLLNDRSLTIDQVSHQLGFSSPSYFSRVFLKHTGETPTAYRLMDQLRVHGKPSSR